MASPACAVRAAPRTRIVALDIGTHGCGYATTFVAGSGVPGPIKMLQQWPNAPQPYPKTRSAILYRGKTPVAWGWTAEQQYTELAADDLPSHTLLRDFKLTLAPAEVKDAREYAKEIAAIISKIGLSPEQVMADYLRLFTKHVKEKLQAEGVTAAELDNVQWCLTVPAMWKDDSKQLMRKAAVRAGLIRNEASDALAIILEPEAAALHARQNNFPPLSPGMTVCVLDVGGGTADITVHDVEERGGQLVLSEAVAATGALCGSAYVDEAFRRKYRERVGAQAYDDWVARHPDEERQVMTRWMAVKHSYQGPAVRRQACTAAGPSTSAATASSLLDDTDDEDEDDTLNVHRVLIPPRLHATMSTAQRQALREQLGSDTDVVLSEEDMQELFEPAISTVIDTTVTHLRQLGAPCSVVVLVGGFAASLYLQSKVKQALLAAQCARQVVVPPHPYAAVLQGGVVYGCCPELIRARRARMAYGIRVSAPWEDGAPETSRFWNDEEGCFYTNCVYDRLVDKGQLVEHDEEVAHMVVPVYRRQAQAAITFYTTDNPDTRFITETDSSMRRLGAELLVDLTPEPDNEDEVDETDLPRVCVKLRFGRTELMASAYDMVSQEPVQTRFRFACS